MLAFAFASSDIGTRRAPVRVIQNLLSLVGVLTATPTLSTRYSDVDVADMPSMEARLVRLLDVTEPPKGEGMAACMQVMSPVPAFIDVDWTSPLRETQAAPFQET